MLTKLDAAVLQSLIDTGARESVELDFKASIDLDSPEQRRNLIEDVCALANARGGWLLLGVAETAGGASALPGIAIGNLDDFRLRLLQMVSNGLEPRLGGVSLECVPVEDGRVVVGVRVPQSWTGPHRTTAQRRFMVRGDAANSEYDILGLRHAFLAGDQVTRAWEAFRDDRISRVYADRLPIRVQTGPAALIHLYPLTAPSTPNAIDPIAAADVHDLVLAQHADRHAFLNIDGVVRCGAGDADGNSTLHVQAFRSGALEAFVSLATPHVDGGVALLWVQQMVSMLVPSWLRGLETLDVPGPYHFAVTLVGVRGTRPVRVGGDELQWGVASREETLLLPAWTITPGETDWARLLQELQRLLHQAYGRDGVDTVYFGPDGAY